MVYALLLIVLIAILVIMMSTKLTKGSSCCGTKEPPVKRIKPSDSDTSHYPHTYELKVEGMVCVNCARRVENAFISQGAASIVGEAGYTLLDIK